MRLTISLDEDLYRYVKARSKNDDVSMSAVINEIVRQKLEPTWDALTMPKLSDRWPTIDGATATPLRVDEAQRAEDDEDRERLERLGWKP